jgi:hypothetical protein
LAYYGIETDRLRRYEARIYDDTLVGFSLLSDEIDKDAEENNTGSDGATDDGEAGPDDGPLMRLAR